MGVYHHPPWGPGDGGLSGDWVGGGGEGGEGVWDAGARRSSGGAGLASSAQLLQEASEFFHEGRVAEEETVPSPDSTITRTARSHGTIQASSS